MKPLFVLAFLYCISIGYGLECYQCLSVNSWDVCADGKKEVACPSRADRCGKARFTGKVEGVSVTVYAKSCALSSECSLHTSDLCKSIDPSVKITDCEFNCCEGNLCNGAKVPMVSAIMLLACTLVAFLY